MKFIAAGIWFIILILYVASAPVAFVLALLVFPVVWLVGKIRRRHER